MTTKCYWIGCKGTPTKRVTAPVVESGKGLGFTTFCCCDKHGPKPYEGSIAQKMGLPEMYKVTAL